MSTFERESEVMELERQAIEATRSGRLQRAVDLWAQIVQIQPAHVAGLTQLGQAAYAQGDYVAARVAFERAAAADGSLSRQWVNVALACQHLRDDAGIETALFKALTLDPYDVVALLLRGQLYERQGKTSQAASSFGAAATLAPPADRVAPDLREALVHAAAYCHTYNKSLATFMDQELEPVLRECGSAVLDRFKLSVDILVGRKRRFESQPMRYFMPQLPTVGFFDRSGFPWLDEVEQAWEAIRDEFLAVLEQDRGFTPYIGYGADQPVAQWAELNHSPRWSAFHLVKDGERVADNAARCPKTLDVWSRTPWPDQPGRTPVALYSLLKPRTRIPPHVGASNCRLVTHLPLIVPPDCGFRVGNETRQWLPGKAWVFDDTIEHEAWNNSEQLRVVLIFDTWHPMLSPEERRLVTAMNRVLNTFSASSSADYDV